MKISINFSNMLIKGSKIIFEVTKIFNFVFKQRLTNFSSLTTMNQRLVQYCIQYSITISN